MCLATAYPPGTTATQVGVNTQIETPDGVSVMINTLQPIPSMDSIDYDVEQMVGPGGLYHETQEETVPDKTATTLYQGRGRPRKTDVRSSIGGRKGPTFPGDARTVAEADAEAVPEAEAVTETEADMRLPRIFPDYPGQDWTEYGIKVKEVTAPTGTKTSKKAPTSTSLV